MVSQGLVEAIATGRVRPDEAAALLAHAVGRVRAGQTRYDVAVEFWVLPWRLLQSLGRGVGQMAGRIPLAAFAWRARFVTGAVAVGQGLAEGRGAFGLISAGVIGLSYVVPWLERQASLAAEDEADRFVAAAGLGDTLSRLLERGHRSQRVLQRVHQLRTAPAPQTMLAS